MTLIRPPTPANDNSDPTGSQSSGVTAATINVAAKNILGFFELLDGWDRAVNDNDLGVTTAEKTEPPSHER